MSWNILAIILVKEFSEVHFKIREDQVGFSPNNEGLYEAKS
jgi:hypothetical protein